MDTVVTIKLDGRTYRFLTFEIDSLITQMRRDPMFKSQNSDGNSFRQRVAQLEQARKKSD